MKTRPVTEAPEGDLGIRLTDTWDDEYCLWHIDFDGGADVAWPWTVVLEWMSESGNPHHADWVTYRWQFYGYTVDAALMEAVEWCDGLLPWAKCPECDGNGAWNGVECPDCKGTGLANA